MIPKETNTTQNTEQTNNKNSSPWSWDKIVFYAFVFLLPIFFLPATLSPVVLGKQLFVGMTMLGLLIYIVVRFLTTSRIVLPSKKITLAVMAFLLVVFISSLLSIEKSVSFMGFSADSMFWVGMYALILILSINIVRDRASVLIASMSFIAGSSLFAIFSLFQLYGVTLLPFEFAQAPTFNTVGTVFSVGFVLAALLTAILSYISVGGSKNKVINAILWMVAGLSFFVILQLNLTSLWIALAVAFTVVAAISGAQTMREAGGKEVNFKPLLAPFFVIIVSVLAILIRPDVTQFMELMKVPAINAPAEISPTASGTWDITKKSLGGTRNIYGTGPGTFQYDFAKHRPLDINETEFWGIQFNQGQSAFLTYLTSWGFLGGATLLALLGLFLYILLRGALRSQESSDLSLRGVSLGALGVLVLFSAGLFLHRGNPTMHLMMFLSVGVGISALIALGIEKNKEFNPAKSPQAMLLSSLFAIIVISFALASVYFLGQQYTGRVYLANGVEEFQSGQNTEGALEQLDKAVTINPKDDLILRTTAQVYALRMQEIAADENMDQEEANQLFSNTLQAAALHAKEATVANPNNVQNWVQLGQVYEQVIGILENAESLALEAYNEAIKVDPHNPSLLLSQARTHITAADALQARMAQLAQAQESDTNQERQITELREEHLNNAVEKAEKSIELKSNYSEARFLLAQAYNRLGQLDKAIEETESIVLRNPSDPNASFQLGLLYYQGEDYEAAKTALERSLTLANGQFANARYYLGLTDFNLGSRDAALDQFERLQEDNPDNELIKRILQNLNAGRDPLAQVQEPQTEPPITDDGGAEDPITP